MTENYQGKWKPKEELQGSKTCTRCQLKEGKEMSVGGKPSSPTSDSQDKKKVLELFVSLFI